MRKDVKHRVFIGCALFALSACSDFPDAGADPAVLDRLTARWVAQQRLQSMKAGASARHIAASESEAYRQGVRENLRTLSLSTRDMEDWSAFLEQSSDPDWVKRFQAFNRDDQAIVMGLAVTEAMKRRQNGNAP